MILEILILVLLVIILLLFIYLLGNLNDVKKSNEAFNESLLSLQKNIDSLREDIYDESLSSLFSSLKRKLDYISSDVEKIYDSCNSLQEELINQEKKISSYCEDDNINGEEENAAMNEKKDKLLFEVAKWAIECGNGLSTSAVQRHFSVG